MLPLRSINLGWPISLTVPSSVCAFSAGPLKPGWGLSVYGGFWADVWNRVFAAAIKTEGPGDQSHLCQCGAAEFCLPWNELTTTDLRQVTPLKLPSTQNMWSNLFMGNNRLHVEVSLMSPWNYLWSHNCSNNQQYAAQICFHFGLLGSFMALKLWNLNHWLLREAERTVTIASLDVCVCVWRFNFNTDMRDDVL